MAPTGPLPRPPHRRPRLLFLSISRVPSAVLGPALRRHLFSQQSEVVVLSGELEGYGDVVQAIKAQFPSLKVLRYTNAQRIPANTRLAATMYCHFLEHVYTEALRLRSGVPKIDGGGTIFTDITNSAARSFIVSHLVQQVAAHGVDGVFIDSFHATLLDYDSYIDGKQKALAWPSACRQILDALRVALPGKQIWFNGLWAFDAATLAAQAELLTSADGASVEFYGYDGRPNPDTPSGDSFGTFVAPINELLALNESKPILVRGTCTGDNYYPYTKSLRQARYCYGCYLLGQTSGSAFSYGQDFQVTRLPLHRTNGTTMLSYFDLALGHPAGPAVHNQTGGWSRPYTGGVVFVTAAAAGVTAQTWVTGQGWWTTRGQKVPSGTSIVVEPGNATILLEQRPPPPPSEFELDLPNAANDYLVEDATGEWLVEGITGEYRYRQMILTVRSSDPESAVLIRFETNDRSVPKTTPFGILTVLPVAGMFDPGNHDYPYGENTKLGALHAVCEQRYPTSGISTPMSINLAQECAPFACFRVMSVRTIGAVEVEGIRLGKPALIPGI